MTTIVQKLVELERKVNRSEVIELGAQYVPLAVPFTSTTFDGDAYGDVAASTEIDLSVIFGAPDKLKAVELFMLANDSAAWGTGGLYFACGPSSSYWYHADVRPCGGDVSASAVAAVPCDANGNIWYRINASGVGTLDLTLRVNGYWI
jgi:hypothetical protein